MKTCDALLAVALAVAAGAPASSLRAEENVTIPKSRLEELERKAAELDKLKGQLNQAQAEKKRAESELRRLNDQAEQLKRARQAAEAKAAAAASAAPALTHETPPIGSLLALRQDEVVDAKDLMNHYRAAAAAAQQRYEAQAIRVEGEVVGFEKPLFRRDYVIYLRTTDPQGRVACRIYPPEKYSAVFTAKGGSELVGASSNGSRFTLAKVGQKALVQGRCEGMQEENVKLTGARLLSVK